MNDCAKIVSLEESMNYDLILFFDCEYTCWENSHNTLWSDPQYPPELLQIGIAVYDIREKRFSKEFSSFARPKINTHLSSYCKNLLEISQEEIDNAKEFPIVSNQISEFINLYTNYSLYICSWGPDYIRISENAIRNNACDPFDTLPRMDLVKEALKVFGVEGNHVLRDDIKEKLGLKKVLNRHNAIADALDLLDIMDALKTYRVKR
jgi:inhibitor of KinA sporulation pathway (predicted exonuclease)